MGCWQGQTHGTDGCLHISGQACSALYLLQGDGVLQLQAKGVKCLPLHAKRGYAAIQCISQQGVTQVLHVYANLVGAACVQLAVHPAACRAGVAGAVAYQGKVGLAGFASLAGNVYHGHTQAVARVAAYGCIYPKRLVCCVLPVPVG